MFIKRIGTAVLGAALILAASAVPASAASYASVSVSSSGETLTYKAAKGQRNSVVFTGVWAETLIVDDRVPIKPGRGCEYVKSSDKTKVACGLAIDVSLIKAYGGDGNDFIHSLAYHAELQAWGGPGNDTLIGAFRNDLLYGGKGNDKIWGRLGDDRLYGEAGNDYLDGGIDDDTLVGGNGNDKLLGFLGTDRLHGGAGNDTLDGGSEGDYLYGNEGDDIVDAGGEYPYSGPYYVDHLDGGTNVTKKGDLCRYYGDDVLARCERKSVNKPIY